MDIEDFTRETVRSRWEYYYDLSERTRDQITFQQYLSLKYPRWSIDEITFQVKQTEEYMATTTRWREAQSNPTPLRSTQICYSCKVPWEPDHRCRGTSNKHIIEVRYDSDDEVCEDGEMDAYLEQSNDDSDSCTEASDSGALEEDSDPCTLEEQLDGQDDNTSVSTDMSHTNDDLTPQQSGDTSEDSHVLAPIDDEHPMETMTHLSYFQTPTIATTYEDSNGMSDMMEEPYMRDTHQRQMDPQIHDEIQDVQTVDLTHTYQHEDIESQPLETPLIEQIVDADRLMEHLLPGSACIDEDALFSSQDDHSTCLDTSI
jgi:hypothetical protein